MSPEKQKAVKEKAPSAAAWLSRFAARKKLLSFALGMSFISLPAVEQAAQAREILASKTAGRLSRPSAAFLQTNTWHFPDIYAEIAAKDQSVVSETVVNVNAFCPCKLDPLQDYDITAADPWTATNLVVESGQKLWIDTAVGARWCWTGSASCDANGIGCNCGENSCLFTGPSIPKSSAALIGFVGPDKPPFSQPGQISWNRTFYSGADAFAVGTYLKNYSPVGSGKIYFMPNDNALGDNSESIPVRIIVTSPKSKLASDFSGLKLRINVGISSETSE